MPRTYTVNSGTAEAKTYHGFNKEFGPELEHVAIFSIDGEVELFAIDTPSDYHDLLNYLADWEPGVITLLGSFSRSLSPIMRATEGTGRLEPLSNRKPKMTFENMVKARETQENIDELKRWHKLDKMSESLKRAKELCRDVLGELASMYGEAEVGEANPAAEAMYHLSQAVGATRRAYLCLPNEDECSHDLRKPLSV